MSPVQGVNDRVGRQQQTQHRQEAIRADELRRRELSEKDQVQHGQRAKGKGDPDRGHASAQAALRTSFQRDGARGQPQSRATSPTRKLGKADFFKQIGNGGPGAPKRADSPDAARARQLGLAAGPTASTVAGLQPRAPGLGSSPALGLGSPAGRSLALRDAHGALAGAGPRETRLREAARERKETKPMDPAARRRRAQRKLKKLGISKQEYRRAKGFLNKMGIGSPEDLAKLGKAAPCLLQVAADVKHRKIGDAVRHISEVYKHLPEGMRGKIRDKLVDTVVNRPPIPKEHRAALAAVVKSAAGLLQDPKVSGALGDALQALEDKNVSGFVDNLAEAGQTIAAGHPDVAKGFLNALGNVKGPVGTFFKDEKLNEALVESGSVENAFGAVRKLAQGDVQGALGELGGAAKKLVQVGDHIKIALHLAPDIHLPIGKDGLEAVGRLFQRVYDVLPDKVKDRVEKKVAELGAKSGIGSIPILGDAKELAAAGKAVFDAIKDGDGIDIALGSAQLVLAAAGLLQGTKIATKPLQFMIGTAKALREVAGAADTIRDLKNAFEQGLA